MISLKSLSTRQSLTQLIEKDRIAPPDIPEAIDIAELHPNKSQWHGFVSVLVFWCGVLGLSTGLIFFIAANWSDMGRIGKFALLESVVLLALLGFYLFYQSERVRKGLILFAMLSVGALMAFFGQTYQTGADPWQLFFNWAVLTTPWVLVSRFNVVWILWIGLLNLSLSLFLMVFKGQLSPAWWMLGFNSLALFIWQCGARYYTWLNHSWSINLLGVVSGYFAIWAFIEGLFDGEILGVVLGIIWASAIFYVYRYRLLNIFMLAGLCLWGIIALNALFVKFMPEDEQPVLFLFMTFLTVALGAFSANWLKKLIQENTA